MMYSFPEIKIWGNLDELIFVLDDVAVKQKFIFRSNATLSEVIFHYKLFEMQRKYQIKL